MAFGVKTAQKQKIPNTWYFHGFLSITNCVWISWVDLYSFHVNRWRTDWDIGNSLKTSQNRDFWSAPSVLQLAVRMGLKSIRRRLGRRYRIPSSSPSHKLPYHYIQIDSHASRTLLSMSKFGWGHVSCSRLSNWLKGSKNGWKSL